MKQKLSRVRQPKNFDFILTAIVVLIAISSFLAIYASFPLLPSYVPTSGFDSVLIKQLQFYILGMLVVAVIMYMGNEHLKTLAKIGYFVCLGLLVYLFIDAHLIQRFTAYSLPFANTVNGATAWLVFPVFGSLQPSEFMKVFLIIISAFIIVDHNAAKEDDSFESDIQLFIKLAKWAVVPLILILIQPDTGIFVVIMFSILVMVICAGIRKEWILWGSVVALFAIFVFFYLFYLNQPLFVKIFGEGYRVKRFYGWLYPEQYATGVGLQLYSALLSMGSSGVLGHGLQSSVISIPEAHTDFIFAVVGTDFGLLGALAVVGLCLALNLRLFTISQRSKDEREKLIVIGFASMLILQQLINIGMVIGLLPISGITLPLISYGGSSILSYMLAFGVVMNASMKAKKLSDYVYE